MEPKQQTRYKLKNNKHLIHLLSPATLQKLFKLLACVCRSLCFLSMMIILTYLLVL